MIDIPKTEEGEPVLSRSELISTLKEQGLNDKTREALRLWQKKRISEIEAIKDPEHKLFKVHQIDFEVECLLVYLVGGIQDLGETTEELLLLRQQALQEGFNITAHNINECIYCLEEG